MVNIISLSSSSTCIKLWVAFFAGMAGFDDLLLGGGGAYYWKRLLSELYDIVCVFRILDLKPNFLGSMV